MGPKSAVIPFWGGEIMIFRSKSNISYIRSCICIYKGL